MSVIYGINMYMNIKKLFCVGVYFSVVVSGPVWGMLERIENNKKDTALMYNNPMAWIEKHFGYSKEDEDDTTLMHDDPKAWEEKHFNKPFFGLNKFKSRTLLTDNKKEEDEKKDQETKELRKKDEADLNEIRLQKENELIELNKIKDLRLKEEQREKEAAKKAQQKEKKKRIKLEEELKKLQEQQKEQRLTVFTENRFIGNNLNSEISIKMQETESESKQPSAPQPDPVYDTEDSVPYKQNHSNDSTIHEDIVPMEINPLMIQPEIPQDKTNPNEPNSVKTIQKSKQSGGSLLKMQSTKTLEAPSSLENNNLRKINIEVQTKSKLGLKRWSNATLILGGATLLTFVLAHTQTWNTNGLLKTLLVTDSKKYVIPLALAVSTGVCAHKAYNLKNEVKKFTSES